jgi:hypothetical protein
MNYLGLVYILHCRFTAAIGLAEAANYAALLKLQPLDKVSCNPISAEIQDDRTSLYRTSLSCGVTKRISSRDDVSDLLAYFPYFEKTEVGLWDHVAVCVCLCIPLSLLGNGSVKIPLSLLANGAVETLPR